MSARLTLDRGAMEVLLNTMSEEAKVDFSGKVIRQVVDKLSANITESQFQKILRDSEREVLKEHLNRVHSYSSPGLSKPVRDQLDKAFEEATGFLIINFRRKLNAEEMEVRKKAYNTTKRMVNDFIAKELRSTINHLAREALQDNLGSLIELGQAMREMKTVTPEVPDGD